MWGCALRVRFQAFGRTGRTEWWKDFCNHKFENYPVLRVKIRTQKEVFFNNGKTDEAGT